MSFAFKPDRLLHKKLSTVLSVSFMQCKNRWEARWEVAWDRWYIVGRGWKLEKLYEYVQGLDGRNRKNLKFFSPDEI